MTLIYTIIYLLKLIGEFCIIFIGLLLWIPCAILGFIGKLFAPIANDLMSYFRDKTTLFWALICGILAVAMLNAS